MFVMQECCVYGGQHMSANIDESAGFNVLGFNKNKML